MRVTLNNGISLNLLPIVNDPSISYEIETDFTHSVIEFLPMYYPDLNAQEKGEEIPFSFA